MAASRHADGQLVRREGNGVGGHAPTMVGPSAPEDAARAGTLTACSVLWDSLGLFLVRGRN